MNSNCYKVVSFISYFFWVPLCMTVLPLMQCSRSKIIDLGRVKGVTGARKGLIIIKYIKLTTIDNYLNYCIKAQDNIKPAEITDSTTVRRTRTQVCLRTKEFTFVTNSTFLISIFL